MTQRTAIDVGRQRRSTGDFVLPGRPKAPPAVLMAGKGPSPRWLEHERAAVARDLGEHFLLLAESQRQLLGELRAELEQCDQAVGDAPRARLKGVLQQALAVLEWCDATSDECAQQARAAVAGWRPIDLLAAAQEALAAHGAPVGHATGMGTWWGDGERLQVCLLAALRLVAERSGGGAVQVEVATDAEGVFLRVVGAGEPAEDVEPESVVAFREAAESLGARVLPDRLGPGGTGLVLRLPPA